MRLKQLYESKLNFYVFLTKDQIDDLVRDASKSEHEEGIMTEVPVYAAYKFIPHTAPKSLIKEIANSLPPPDSLDLHDLHDGKLDNDPDFWCVGHVNMILYPNNMDVDLQHHSRRMPLEDHFKLPDNPDDILVRWAF